MKRPPPNKKIIQKNDTKPPEKRRNILFRTTLLLWIVIILTVGLFALLIIPYQKQLLRDRTEETAKAIATSIEQVTVTSVVLEDYSFVIEHCLRVISENPTVHYVVLTRHDGFSLIHQPEKWSRETLKGIWKPAKDQSSKSAIINSPFTDEKVFHFLYPLLYSGIDWGWISIGLSLEEFTRDLRFIYLRTLFVTIICIFIGLIASFLFARRLSGPIQKLNDVTNRVAAGDLSARAHITSGDEIENLATSFNRMTETIETSQNRFKQVAEIVREWIWEIDENGLFTYSNPIIETILGFTADEIVNTKNIYDFFAPEEKKELTNALSKIIKNKQTISRFITLNIHKNGDKVYLEKNAVPLFDSSGHCIGYRGSDFDITQRFKLEQLKNEFVSTVSHEMRTPLAIIKEGALLSFEGVLGTISNQQKKFLTISINAIERLERIISDLLDISKIESGKIEMKEEFFNLVALVNETINSFKNLLKEKPFELKTHFSSNRITVHADKNKLTQVFTNLIDNAAKFTKKGYIEIAIDEKDSVIECRVSDTGKGIAKQHIPKLFNKFQQFGRVDGPGIKGTGLGLSICKGIVELHGGKIWAESEINKGTSIIFILPKPAKQ